jgi:large subunit ribosomal protein L25
LRATGRVPGVLYRAGESLPFSTDALETAAVLRHGANLIDLEVDDKTYAAVVKDYQLHPVRSNLVHIDLQEVRMDETVRLAVPIEIVGESPGVKAGGVLTQAVHEINLECTPVNIPDTIKIDVGILDVGGALHLSDVTFPEGVNVLDSEELLVVAISVPRKVVATAAEEAAEGEAAAEGGAAAPAEGGDGGAS